MKAKRMIPLLVGGILLAVFLLLALFPQWFTPYGRKEMFTPWLAPEVGHILGCNDMGYDIWTELVFGARDTIVVGALSGLLTLALGTFIGILSTQRGFLGAIFQGLIHIFVLLPKLIILIVLIAFLEKSRLHLILLIGFFSWAPTAREVRSKVLSLKEMPFMEALRVSGYSKIRITFLHILPNIKDILATRALLTFTSCIMMESSLSFLGLGDLFHPSWGTMMNYAYKHGAFFRRAYAYLLAPGFAIALVALAFYFLSRYIEEKNHSIKEIF